MNVIKKYYRTAFIIGMVFLGCSIWMTSCTEEESVKTELLSFGPSGVQHGEDIVFVGTGLDKITAIVFPVDVEVPKSEFKSQTSGKIVVTVPVETTEGKVVLKSSAGDIETKTNFGLSFEIVVSGVPDEAKPGTNATFTGEFLNYVKEVIFSDGLSVTDFVSQSRTELVVTVPMEAKTGPIQFSDGKEDPQIAEEVLTVTLPEVTGIAPSSVKHAANLTLSGTDLDLVTSVKFPGGAIVLSANFSTHSTDQIVLAVPVTATDGKLTLSVASGVTVETASSISIILPIVTAFSPSDPSNHTPGATLTMTGTDLDLVDKIKFPSVAALVTSFVKTGTTQIDVVIPAGAEGGTVVLTTIHGFTVPVTVPFGNQLTLLTTIYDDVVHNPFGPGGGWNTTTDAANTENPRVGTKSIKVTYGGSWGGGGQFGTWCCSPLSTAGASYYAFSIYGGPGTEGKEINVNVSGQQIGVVVKEGQWKDVKILLSDVGSPASLSEVWFQDKGWSGYVYIDQIGLK